MPSPTDQTARTESVETVFDACVEVLRVERASLSESTHFADDLEADSLALVEIVMVLEEKCDLRIPEDDLKDISTIGAAADLVATRRAEAA